MQKKFKLFRANFIDGILAGVVIAIGGGVYLSVENKIAAAILFSVALLSVCYMGFSLYTGKIGFMMNEHKVSDFVKVYSGLLGNLVGTLLCGLVVAAILPNLHEVSVKLCAGKLASQSLPQTLGRGFFCGILMYLSVYIFREKHTIAGIVFCIPVFILSGFEHSIADMFYFFTAQNFAAEAWVFLLIVVLGNTLGGLFIPALQALKGRDSNAAA